MRKTRFPEAGYWPRGGYRGSDPETIPSVPEGPGASFNLPAERDCGKQGHVFTVLCDLDKVPRLARCSECHREWAFGMVLEVNRIP